jgi:hypothetical protein
MSQLLAHLFPPYFLVVSQAQPNDKEKRKRKKEKGKEGERDSLIHSRPIKKGPISKTIMTSHYTIVP